MKRRRINYSDAELAFLEGHKSMRRNDLAAQFSERFNRPDVSADNIKGLCLRKGWITGQRKKGITTIIYSAEELRFVQQNYHGKSKRDLYNAFFARFGRDDVSIKNLQSLCTKQGWRVRGKCRGKITYSDDELIWVKTHCALPRSELHAKFCAEFNRKDIIQDNLKSLCTRKGWKTGRDGCFQKGTVPPNKGKRGICAAGSEKGHFKKGSVPPNVKPIGYERICQKNGYIMIKVARPNPYTGAATRIMPKHRYLWEEEHGKIPKRHVLRCLNGDILDTEPRNWICVSLGLNARLNVAGYNQAPPELRETILAEQTLRDKVGQYRPTPIQKMMAKEDYVPPSKRAAPAAHLRELIEETEFSFNVECYASDIDAAIGRAWKGQANASDWAVPLPFLPGEIMTNPIHVDWKRLRGRPDLRNRLREVAAL